MFLSDATKSHIFQITAVLLLVGSVLTIGTINLSMLFDLMQEIIDNADVIIGLVILSVVIGMAIKIGNWMGDLLQTAISKKK